MVIFLTYEEVCNYIEEIPKFTVKHSPEHTKRLLACLGHPERDFAVIHVAGSNGKGSVCRAVSHVLTENGTRTGLFISPHLVCMEERMQEAGILRFFLYLSAYGTPADEGKLPADF